jgi:hypothetical protein
MDLTKTKLPAETVYPVGTKVCFTFGLTEVVGRITEDRGKIGHRGRRLYGIRFWEDQEEPHYIELPAEEFSLVKSVV